MDADEGAETEERAASEESGAAPAALHIVERPSRQVGEPGAAGAAGAAGSVDPGSSVSAVKPRGPADQTGRAPGRVVLVHGAMDRGGSFGRVANRLHDMDVLSYDRRGYARSAGVGPSSSFDDQVTDLMTVLAGRPAVVAGHSFGGNVVLTAAERAPELVRAAVVFEPPAPWEQWWPGSTRRSAVGRTPEETAEAFMRRMVGDRVWEHLPARTREERRSEGATLLAELGSVGTLRPYDPSRITVPVVVGWGSDTPAHMSRAARLLVDELADATPVEVRGSSHGAHLSHPADFAAMIRLAADLAIRRDGPPPVGQPAEVPAEV